MSLRHAPHPRRRSTYRRDPAALPLESEDYRLLRLILDLVDHLGARGGWDPAELIDQRTHQSFSPLLERTRAALLSYEADRAQRDRRPRLVAPRPGRRTSTESR